MNKGVMLLLFIFIMSFLLSYSDDNLKTSRSLTNVNDFLYQLQNINLKEIAMTDYDLVIIDYSEDGTEDGEWDASQIKMLKFSRGGKIVLAYISIGEAENYRYYWRHNWKPNNPDWLGHDNPDWEGNYKVKYWHGDWQKIILSYIDKIITQGFDGIYMDIVDGYWYWANEAKSNGENEQLSSDEEAANHMVDFIKKIANYCRDKKRKTDFIICPQNGSDIINDASPQKVVEFWNAIDAIGAEDTFYFGNLDENNSYKPQDEIISNLDKFVEYGKKVLATDYLTIQNTKAIKKFYSLCKVHGFVPFATLRDLDILRINKGYEPD